MFFPTVSALSEHSRMNHANYPRSTSLVQCPFCSRSFASSVMVFNHANQVMLIVNIIVTRTKSRFAFTHSHWNYQATTIMLYGTVLLNSFWVKMTNHLMGETMYWTLIEYGLAKENCNIMRRTTWSAVVFMCSKNGFSTCMETFQTCLANSVDHILVLTRIFAGLLFKLLNDDSFELQFQIHHDTVSKAWQRCSNCNKFFPTLEALKNHFGKTKGLFLFKGQNKSGFIVKLVETR